MQLASVVDMDGTWCENCESTTVVGTSRSWSVTHQEMDTYLCSRILERYHAGLEEGFLLN